MAQSLKAMEELMQLGFYHSIDLCYKIIKGNLMNEIKSNLNHLESEYKINNKKILSKNL